uniref:Tachykinin precursor 3b n=1 Tax=Sinocyclocheilus anshuiensis TaxID=1608454 RepID=A0A671M1G5_9TELE
PAVGCSCCSLILYVTESFTLVSQNFICHPVCSVQDNSDPQSERYEKRHKDIDYDSFIGLMGRRTFNSIKNAQDWEIITKKSNMNDIFVGLRCKR